MKKALVLIFVLMICLALCACGSKYVCAKCGDDYEHQPAHHSTQPYCRDCHNAQPNTQPYCVCGNRADASRGGAYLCTQCWNNVENAVQNALG